MGIYWFLPCTSKLFWEKMLIIISWPYFEKRLRAVFHISYNRCLYFCWDMRKGWTLTVQISTNSWTQLVHYIHTSTYFSIFILQPIFLYFSINSRIFETKHLFSRIVELLFTGFIQPITRFICRFIDKYFQNIYTSPSKHNGVSIY